jgi:hypothetical protein
MKVLKVAFQIQPATKLAANIVIIVISNLFQNGIFFSKLLMGGQNDHSFYPHINRKKSWSSVQQWATGYPAVNSG